MGSPGSPSDDILDIDCSQLYLFITDSCVIYTRSEKCSYLRPNGGTRARFIESGDKHRYAEPVGEDKVRLYYTLYIIQRSIYIHLNKRVADKHRLYDRLL